MPTFGEMLENLRFVHDIQGCIFEHKILGCEATTRLMFTQVHTSRFAFIDLFNGNRYVKPINITEESSASKAKERIYKYAKDSGFLDDVYVGRINRNNCDFLGLHSKEGKAQKTVNITRIKSAVEIMKELKAHGYEVSDNGVWKVYSDKYKNSFVPAMWQFCGRIEEEVPYNWEPEWLTCETVQQK